MKVTVHFLGILSKYTRADMVEFELENGGTYRDLLKAIGEKFGACFPDKMWDSEKICFADWVTAVRPQGDIKDLETSLENNDLVHLLVAFPGG